MSAAEEVLTQGTLGPEDLEDLEDLRTWGPWDLGLYLEVRPGPGGGPGLGTECLGTWA